MFKAIKKVAAWYFKQLSKTLFWLPSGTIPPKV